MLRRHGGCPSRGRSRERYSDDNNPGRGTIGAGVRQRRRQEIFGAMHTSLNSLVDDVVHVHYIGPNADMFKAKCGQIAADFANKMHADIAAMAEAVRASTSEHRRLAGRRADLDLRRGPSVHRRPGGEESTPRSTDVETSGLGGADAAGDPATSPRCARACRATSRPCRRPTGPATPRRAPSTTVSSFTTSAQDQLRHRRDVDHHLHRQPARERPQPPTSPSSELTRSLPRWAGHPDEPDWWSHGADRPGVLERGRCC